MMRTTLCVCAAGLASACRYDESYLACFDAPDTHVTGMVALAEVEGPWAGNGCVQDIDAGVSLNVDGTQAMVPLCVGPSAQNLYLHPLFEVRALYEWYGGEAHALATPEASEAASCPDELVQYRLPAFTSDRAYAEVPVDGPGELDVWLTPRDKDEWRDELW